MNKDISLVLSGGGARGLAHIGVIEELEKQGFNIKSITGVSMGSVVGGVYAAGKMEEYRDWMISLERMDILKLVDFTFGPQGLVKGDRVLEKMKEFVPDVEIEKLTISYRAIATNLTDGKERIIDSGSLYAAIRASISIPSIMTPIKTGDELLVDGAVINNIPSKYAKREDGDLLVVSNVSADVIPTLNSVRANRGTSKSAKLIKEYIDKLRATNVHKGVGYFKLLNKTIQILRNQLTNMTLEMYPPDILINISKDESGFFDFHRTEELVKAGREIAKNVLIT